MSDLSTFQIGLIIIPVIVGLTIVALFFLGRFWRRRANEELKQFQGEFRRYQMEVRNLATTANEFAGIGEEPYNSRVATLETQISDISTQLTNMQAGYVTIQERIRRVTTDPWKGILGAPLFWYMIKRDITNLKLEYKRIDDSLQSAEQTVISLNQLGWEIAQKTREARGIDLRVQKMLTHLQGYNIHGDVLDAAVQSEQRARDALSRIPDYFLNTDRGIVLEKADSESITQSHQILEETVPNLNALIKQTDEWERQYSEATKTVTRMRKMLGVVDGSVTNAPDTLNLAEYIQQIDGMNIISHNLQETLTRLEVQSMPVVIEEAERVQRRAQEMDVSLKRACEQSGELSAILNDLNQSLRLLSDQFVDLATSAVHPVTWNRSKNVLADLSRGINELGTIDTPRTIEQVDQDVQTATRLQGVLSELTNHCQVIAQQHTELEHILVDPDISQAKDWFQVIDSLVQRVNLYAPENWSQNNQVESLEDDLGSLEDWMERLVFENQTRPISEDELGNHLEQVQQMSDSFQSQKERLANIGSVLTEIQTTESRAREQIKSTEAALNQLSYIVGSNTFLDKVARKQINRYEDDLSGLIGDLNRRGIGSIDKKAMKINSLANKLKTSTQKWHEQLSKDLQEQTIALLNTLTTLDAIATVEDKALDDARKLLSSTETFNESSSKAPTGFEDLIQDLKQRSDYWQECLAVRNAVKGVEDPIMETYSQAEENRDYVHEQYADLADWLERTSEWPPTSVSLESEELEIKSLDMEWDAVKQMSYPPISLVQRISNLDGKYQTLSEKIFHAGERVADQQERIEQIEKDLDEFERRWRAQRKAHSDSPMAQKEIDDLLSRADREYERIKNDYRNGELDFDGVEQALKLVQRRVRVAQVSLDDSSVIGMDDRVSGYRG